jgi:hypothetical protein
MSDIAPPAVAKPWWASKMIWFNVLGLVTACAAAAELALPALQGAFPGSKILLVLAFVLPVGNAALRFITTTGIAWGWNK